MKRETLVFAAMMMAGVLARVIALDQLDWFLGDTLHVDEITYSQGGSPPYERPPGMYLVSGLDTDVGTLRLAFSAISMIPALAFFLFMGERNLRSSILAGILAVEPTLAFSGLQVLPAAPAAALTALALTSGKKPLLFGWLLGCAALFRGEMILFLPVSALFIRPLRRWIATAAGTSLAVVPLMLVNLFSGGSFQIAENGALNLWLGSSWELLEVPPGIEYEQFMGRRDFFRPAVDAILGDPLGWSGRGAVKTAAFFTVPGPGRNLESGRLLGTTVLGFLLPITGLVLAAGASALRKNPASALMVTGAAAAFFFFPSIRHRAVLIPAFVMAAGSFRWKPFIPAVLLIAAASFMLDYPAKVRSGLTELQHAEHLLRRGDWNGSMEYIRQAELAGYEGADLHSIKGACIDSSEGDFRLALEEFSMALLLAPDSPTAWRNMAAFLWNNQMPNQAREAAEKAVSLNPGLREELEPILSVRL